MKLKSDRTVVRSIRLPLRLWRAVQKEAQRNFTTPAAIIRRAVAEWLKKRG